MKLPTDYQAFIACSRYARWIDSENRRETWEETVRRYYDFMQEHIKERCGYDIPLSLREELEYATLHLEVMPSMRALMTAGAAAKRDEIATYNCSYTTVDDVRVFDEVMYILLCGTGVGYSVESKYVNKLPVVAEHFEKSGTVIHVEDSKIGWCKALRELIAMLYVGQVPGWDVSAVRPAGAKLKTFGGRASGPGPLVQLFEFVTRIITGAAGRKLTTLECHDILCKIGEVVVVGGVRRSAMISLSDLNDDLLRVAKSGNWWERNPQRALANNSWVADKRPDVSTFLGEFKSLYDSYSGERGIFSRSASRRKAAENGRRDSAHDFGTNPCSEIILRPKQLCNLTEVVVRADDTLDTLRRKVQLATILGTFQSTLTNFRYLSKKWKQNCEEERLLGVSLTGIMDNPMLNNPDDVTLPETLNYLREHAVLTNRLMAEKLGINPSTAISCVKPSGTVSQLVDAASGIHPRYAQYYIRTVRGDAKDPLTNFMKDQGIPWEPCVMKPQDTVVFSFPIAAPEGSVLRDDLPALKHLALWKIYADHWCEHKPSITVEYKPEEFPDIQAWMWRNLDGCSGVSFLPRSEHTYQQAPYQPCDKLTYDTLYAKMPTEIDWSLLSRYETEDTTEGVSTMACSAGACEIVDVKR